MTKTKTTKKLKSLYQHQKMMYVLIFTLVTVVIWAGVSIFLTSQETPIDPELIELSTPLNPNLNLQVIQELENKKSYSQTELSQFTIYTLINHDNTQERVILTLDEYRQIQTQKAAEQAALVEQRQTQDSTPLDSSQPDELMVQ